MYYILYLMRSRSALSDIKHKATGKADSFISDEAWTASVLNGLKNDPTYEFISEVILKIKKIKGKAKLVYMIFYHK